MVIVGDDVVVKYTLSKKILERFSIGWDWSIFLLLELSYRYPCSIYSVKDRFGKHALDL
jgi:hypothetical protein